MKHLINTVFCFINEKNLQMKAPTKTRRFVLLFALWVMMATLAGCAAINKILPTDDNKYERILEKRLENVRDNRNRFPDEVTTPRELPDLTSEEHERLGDLNLRRGNLHLAFVHYQKSLYLAPENTRIHFKKGMMFVVGKMNEEAIESFHEVLKKDPGHALAYEGLGHAFFQLKKYDEAEKNFREAIHLDDTLWRAHNFLGIIYDYKREHESAVPEYEAAIALNSDEGALYNNLGTSYSLAGRYEEAVSAFNQALENGFSQSKVYNNLGLALAKLGRYQEAFEAFEKAGGVAQAYNNLGCAHFGQNQYEEATRCFVKAIERKPNFYTKADENLKTSLKSCSGERFFDPNINSSSHKKSPQ